MKDSSLAVVFVSLVLVLVFPYILLSGFPVGEAAGSSPNAMVSVVAFNSSSEVLHDYPNTYQK